MEVSLIFFYLLNYIFLCLGNIPEDCNIYCPTSCYEKGFASKYRRQSDINLCLQKQLDCGCARLEEDAARRERHMIEAIAYPAAFFLIVGILLLITLIRVKVCKRDPAEPIVIQCACTDYIARRLGTLPPQYDSNLASQHVSTISHPITAQPAPRISP